jgi:O-antigen/teichoic acid export membrane protein
VGLLNVQKLSELFVQIGVLAAGGHAIGLATGMLFNMLVWCVLGWIDAKRKCPLISWSFGPIDLVQARSMLVDGLPVFANSAAAAFFLQGYPNIVNGILGSHAVVTLTTVRTGSRTLLQMVGIVNNASGSELSRTYGSKDWDGYLRILKVLIVTTAWASVAAVVGLTLFGPWVILKWTAGKVIISHQLMFLFAISVACQCCWLACGGVLFSTNMHHAFNYIYLALTLLGLSVVGWAIHEFGFVGVPIVMVVADAILLAWVLYICRRKLAFISMASLGRIFSPAFYFEKAGGLVRHLSSRGKVA